MKNINKTVQQFVQQDSAATSVEYAILIGAIILVCFGAIGTVGGETLATWFSNSEQISQAMEN